MRALTSPRHRLILIAQVVIAAALLFATTRSSSADGDLVFVVNAKNADNPDIAEIKKLFLGDSSFFSGNVPAKLFVRPADSPAGNAFFRAISVAPPRFKRIWQEKQLSGAGTPPETIADAAALVARVGADPGGIGFALSDEMPANPAGVRVITPH